jgi:hypothetical protein
MRGAAIPSEQLINFSAFDGCFDKSFYVRATVAVVRCLPISPEDFAASRWLCQQQ